MLKQCATAVSISLGDILFRNYYLHMPNGEEDYQVKVGELLLSCKKAFEELKTNHQHLLPSFMSGRKDIIDRFYWVGGENRMIMVLCRLQ